MKLLIGIGSFLYSFGGYKAPFFLFGIIVLLCLPFNWYFLDKINDTDDDKEEDSLSNESETEQIKATYWNMIKIPKIFVICIVIVVMALAAAILEPTLEPHLRKLGLKQEIIGLEFILSSTAYALSTPVVGYFSSRIENKFSFMLIGTSIATSGLIIIGPSKILFFLSPNTLFSTIGIVLIQFGHGVG